MPLVEITLRRGKSVEYLRVLGEAVHGALVAQANVPADDRFQIVHQVGEGELIADPSYAAVSRSEDLVVVRITLNVGRTLEVKKNLYADMARRASEAVDLRPDDLLICLVEVARENWSFGKGLATYG